MQNVFQTAAIQIGDVVIVQGVVYVAAVLAGPHQAHLSQMAQVMRDRGFTYFHCLRQGAHVQLTGRQGGDDAHTAGVAQRAE